MVIQPYLTYGSFLWWQKTELSFVKTKLNHLQRLVCLGITGALSTTPTAGMEALLGIAPLNLRVVAEAKHTAYRLKKKGQNKFNEIGHSKIWQRISFFDKVSNAPMDSINKKLNIDKKLKTKIPSRDDSEILNMTPLDIIKVFTDGSFKDNKAGAGIFCEEPHLEEVLNLGKYPTVFQAEVIAISRAAEALINKNIANKNIIVFSDSQAAIKALDNYWCTSVLVDEGWRNLQRLAANNEVTICWVPGHSGIEGNEKADELARNGSENEYVGPTICLPLPYSCFRMQVKNWLSSEHNKLWRSLDYCRQTKDYLSDIDTSKTRELWKLPKNKLCTVMGVLTGHCHVNKHLHNLGLVRSTLCDRCSTDEESAYHIVCLCPAYARLRFRVLGDHTLNLDQYKKLTVSEVLRFVELTGRFSI